MRLGLSGHKCSDRLSQASMIALPYPALAWNLKRVSLWTVVLFIAPYFVFRVTLEESMLPDVLVTSLG